MPRIQSQTKMMLEGVLNYLCNVRGVGHSKAVVNGAKSNTDVVIVTATTESGKHLTEHSPANRQMALQGFAHGGMAGYRSPVVFDNYAVLSLCSMAIADIEAFANNAETERLAKEFMEASYKEKCMENARQQVVISDLLTRLEKKTKRGKRKAKKS